MDPFMIASLISQLAGGIGKAAGKEKAPKTGGADWLSLGLGALGGLFGGNDSGGSNTASRAAANIPVVDATRRVRAGKLLDDYLKQRFAALQAGGPGTTEQLEQDVLGGRMRDIALGNLSRQEAGTAQRLSQQFQSRGLLGSGLEGAAQGQVAGMFGQERARVATQEDLNRVMRRLADINDLQDRLASFSAGAPFGSLPQMQQPVQQQNQLGQFGGLLFQHGLENVFSNVFGGNKTEAR